MLNVKQTFIDNFVRYASIPTGSDSSSQTHPSTKRQFDLAYLLRDELISLGLEATVSDTCYVYSTLNTGKSPKVVLLAHMDTSEDAPNENVHPKIHTFAGQDIKLQDDVVLQASELVKQGCAPDDVLITSDGTTLLGGDDKAGIAIIMTLLRKIQADPGLRERMPQIQVCFTPDEEIGSGVECVDFEALQAGGPRYAVTVDGSNLREISLETFCARGFAIEISGYNCHPGDAYGTMVNALAEGARLCTQLVQRFRAPEQSRGREEYLMANRMTGEVGKCSIHGIIRSFDREMLESMSEQLRQLVTEFQAGSRAKIALEIKEQYTNLKYYLQPDVVETFTALGKKYGSVVTPIRGGTDGARLSEMGLQCPNIWNGSFNFHSVREVVNVSESVDCVAFLQDLLLM